MVGLRERRHQETRQRMVEAAFTLFERHGFDRVTMEEIARAAGVSRSTAYRRFAAKEDLVLEVARNWLEVFDDATAEVDGGEALSAAIRIPCMAVAAHIDANAELVRAAYAVLEQAETLRASGVATTAWLERFVELAHRHGGADQESAAVVAGAYLGAIDATMQLWADGDGGRSAVELIDQLLHRLEPIL